MNDTHNGQKTKNTRHSLGLQNTNKRKFQKQQQKMFAKKPSRLMAAKKAKKATKTQWKVIHSAKHKEQNEEDEE